MKKQDHGKSVVDAAAKMAAAKAAKVAGAAAGDAASPLVAHAGTVPQDIGTPPRVNRTGATAAPLRTKKQLQDAAEVPPTTEIPPADMHLYCAEEERTFGLMGTMPPPTSMKGVVKTAMQALAGNKATVLIDKLGERLAFERTGTRLYDGLLAKLAAKGSYDGGPTAEELARIRDEELSHFHLLVGALRGLGADPTAMTPSANVSAVASMGLIQVINDPRATLPDALHAIHVAELTDADGWRLLIETCESVGKEDLAEKMRVAEANETEHLAMVRRWLAAYAVKSANREAPMEGEAGVEATT